MASQSLNPDPMSRVFETPVLAWKRALCFSCLDVSSNLHHCGACKRVAYCSKDCQKKDWSRNHKNICKTLVALNAEKGYTAPTGRRWEDYSREQVLDLSKTDPVKPCELGRWIWEELYCYHCYRRESQLEEGARLITCQSCRLTSFCNSCPQTHPPMECIGLQDLTADDKIRMTLTKNADPIAIYYCSDIPRKQYVPLASTANWFEYFTRLSTHDHGKLNMNRDLRCLSNIPEEQALVNTLRYSTNLISLHFTLIAALEAIIPDVGSRTSITLHIIGAAEIEFITLRAFQELLHFFPALTALNVSFVGLNVLGGKTSKGIQIPQSSDTHQCCAMCTKRGRKILFTTWKGAYHLYVKTELYKKPDLAAAFRAQFTTNDQVQWGPTIMYLARAPHPTLFTEVSYREIQQQMAVWKELGAGIAKQPEINTWRGMSPSLTYEQAKPNEVWYLNGWWYIVKKC